jgi:hypothetical protein
MAQRWDLTLRAHRHRVDVQGLVVRSIRWYVDDNLVATRRTVRDTVLLEAEPGIGDAIELQFGVLGQARRVTLFEGDETEPARERAAAGTGGIDLDPEPGSAAERREQRIREHPWRHAVIATAVGAAKVVIPLLLGLVVVGLAVRLPWPDWAIPWPDLPAIPWPAIPWPEIPWPDVHLPTWHVPEWVRLVGRVIRHGWPVLLALVLAKIEIERRREQDALKAQMRGEQDPAADLRRDGSTDDR